MGRIWSSEHITQIPFVTRGDENVFPYSKIINMEIGIQTNKKCQYQAYK